MRWITNTYQTIKDSFKTAMFNMALFLAKPKNTKVLPEPNPKEVTVRPKFAPIGVGFKDMSVRPIEGSAIMNRTDVSRVGHSRPIHDDDGPKVTLEFDDETNPFWEVAVPTNLNNDLINLNPVGFDRPVLSINPKKKQPWEPGLDGVLDPDSIDWKATFKESMKFPLGPVLDEPVRDKTEVEEKPLLDKVEETTADLEKELKRQERIINFCTSIIAQTEKSIALVEQLLESDSDNRITGEQSF